jgi:glycerate kinase
VAPDKFKGSLSAMEAARAMVAGVRAALPGAGVQVLPIADGGDGSVDAALGAGGTPVHLHVPTSAGSASVHDVTVAVLERTVVAEVAQVGGLGRRKPTPEQARSASSWAAGALVDAALNLGPERLVLGVGGTASTDAGAGALVALGARFVDTAGHPVVPGLAGLADIASMDLSGVDRRIFGPGVPVELVVAADVDSPLTGFDGAVMVFGRQKGLPEGELIDAEASIATFVRLLEVAAGFSVAELPGAGAGGGLAGGLSALRRSPPVPGADAVFALIGVDDALGDCDLVVTAEGALDEQSLRGKAPVALARRARAAGVPCVAVAGRVELGERALRSEGIHAAAALVDLEPDVARAMAEPSALVAGATQSVVAAWVGEQL